MKSNDDQRSSLRWHWDNAEAVAAKYRGAVGEEILRQQGRTDITPSGLPVNLPTDEEWKERAARFAETLRQWQKEAPSDDLATLEELLAGLKAHPVQFREVHLDEWDWPDEAETETDPPC